MRKQRTAKVQNGFSGLSVIAGTASAPQEKKVVPSEKKKTMQEESPPLQFKACLNLACGKKIDKGYYGMWSIGNGGVCCKECNDAYGAVVMPHFYGNRPRRQS